MRLFILVLLLSGLGMFLPESKMHAQELNFTHYSVESGMHLPSNEVYGILVDKNHVVWATTDRGVWRYDGYTPRQFTVADGLKENTNFRIFADSAGAIWVSSQNNYLHRIYGDSVTPFALSNTIHNLASPAAFIQQISQNPDGSLYLCFNRPGLFRLKPGEPAEKVKAHRINHPKACLAIHYSPDNFYWDMLTIPDGSASGPTSVYSENGWIYLSGTMLNNKNHFRKDIAPIGPEEFLMSYDKKVFHIRDGHLVGERTFTNGIIDVYADNRGNFWVGLEYEGVKRFLHQDLDSEPLGYLAGEWVTGICQDHEGNYWRGFSTQANGIFETNSLDFEIYSLRTLDSRDNMITSMDSDGDNIYLGTKSGLLLKISSLPDERYRLSTMPFRGRNGAIRRLIATPEHHLIIFNDNLHEIDTSCRYCGIRKIDDYPYAYLRERFGLWFASFPTSIKVVQGNKILRTWNEESIRRTFPDADDLSRAIIRVRCMMMDSKGNYWMGSQSQGLYNSKDSVNFKWSARDTLFSKWISDIEQAGENIWVSLKDYGLAIIRPDSSFIRITAETGLSSDNVDVLFAENDSVVWAGSNNGLNRISMKPGASAPERIVNFTLSEGLPSSQIFDIIRHRGDIWIATSRGVVRLDEQFIRPLRIQPELVTGPLMVNEEPRQPTDGMVLRWNENNLVFRFKAITYRKPGRLLYRYKLEGADKDYVTTSNIEARYPDRRPGEYTFSVNASYTGVFDPATEQQISFRILGHWYQTTLALITWAVMILLLIYLIFIMVVRINRNREMQKRRLLQAEKRSLLSQMNPHFIFNSLNSIQHFIIQHDEIQANTYLTDFSGLIRRILENSKKNLIPLHEEISTLTLYLGMEKLRFENEFEFEILKDSHIDYHETMIPPMLLQPFVENAIWHGLLPLKAAGSLTITFSDYGDFFQCRIEDNGIGRERAMNLKKKKDSHVSSGIRNVQERVEILNNMNRKKIHLIITDLHRSDGTASGTLVEFFLPKDLKF